ASAPSPSAVRVTVSPCPAPRAITPSRLRASTGAPPCLAMVTGTPVAAAALTNRPAGRACRPTAEAMVTSVLGMCPWPFSAGACGAVRPGSGGGRFGGGLGCGAAQALEGEHRAGGDGGADDQREQEHQRVADQRGHPEAAVR